MKWDYRIVNTKSQNSGEDWYCLQEVFYNDKGVPYGYSAPCMGSETIDGVREVWKMMQMALLKAPMQEEEFTNDNFEGEYDDE